MLLLQRFETKSIIWFSGFRFMLIDVFTNAVIRHLNKQFMNVIGRINMY